jgi:hypothetical protein
VTVPFTSFGNFEIGSHAPRGNYTLLYDGEGEIDFRLAKIHTIYNGKGI